ncbi:sodium:solute symporter [Deltaproteobacteria bacterium]|nr:sodium:solute symporter [Deltaproteobacteria bacterium]
MTTMHYLGALLVFVLITGLGLYSGSRVKSAGDFSGGSKKAGVGIVAGSIIGTLVGGSATIGTAQLAFNFGFSAWWFTLGGGIGCLVLGGFYAKPLYESGVTTMPQALSREYGRNVATAATVLTSLGSFLSVVAQVLASVALVTSVTDVPSGTAAFITLILMVAYVLFGGVWGAGIVGIAKTVLLYIAVGACGIMAVLWQGGLSSFTSALPVERYFSLVARGGAVDIGAGLSLLIGVLTTQTYIQSVISAKNLRLSRTGVFLSAALIPLVGVAGIFVGLYMRLNAPDINSASALPIFVLRYMPPLFAGAVLATLLVAVVGTAAGVSLGLSSMFCNDIYRVYCRPDATDKRLLLVSRVALAAILGAAALVSVGNLGSLILGWSFMSMGLRGAVAFGVLSTALFLPGRIPRSYALASMFVGPVCILLGKPFIGSVIDPLFFGVFGSLVVLAAGYYRYARSNRPASGG